MRLSSSRVASRAGFTIVELLIAFAIFGLLLVNVWMVMKASKSAAESGIFRMSLDDELNLTVDRISLALMAANNDDLELDATEPFTTDRVVYSSSLGLNDGEVVRGPVEEIQWLPTEGDDGRVVWSEEPAEAARREVNWSRNVPDVYEGESDGNGVDDNHNGVADEGGLGFTREGSRVEIYVTIERVNSEGKRVPNSTVRPVTCRN